MRLWYNFCLALPSVWQRCVFALVMVILVAGMTVQQRQQDMQKPDPFRFGTPVTVKATQQPGMVMKRLGGTVLVRLDHKVIGVAFYETAIFREDELQLTPTQDRP